MAIQSLKCHEDVRLLMFVGCLVVLLTVLPRTTWNLESRVCISDEFAKNIGTCKYGHLDPSGRKENFQL